MLTIKNRETFLILYLYLNLPFWYASATYQASLAEPWFVPMARTTEPVMPLKRTKNVRLGIYRTQIQPKILLYGNKICQALYRVARKEKNRREQTLPNRAKKWWIKKITWVIYSEQNRKVALAKYVQILSLQNVNGIWKRASENYSYDAVGERLPV